MKAIVDVAPSGAVFETAAAQLAAGCDADYHLHFETPHLLLSHLTTARLELLDTLRQQGACGVAQLARAAGRTDCVHEDLAALEDLGLIERDEHGAVFMPFDAVEIHMELAAA